VARLENDRARVFSALQAALSTLLVLLTVQLAGRAIAEDEPGPADQQDTVVALVGEDPIRAGEVARLVARVTRGQPATAAARAILEAQTLEEIIDRRLVLAYARQNDEAPTDEQIAAARAECEAKLARQRRSLEEFLRAESLSKADFDRQLAWNVVWPKYLSRYRTEARAAAYFQARHREFDGTELAVSQILLRQRPGETPGEIAGALERAAAIGAEIAGGKMSFADAARKYSAAPSAKQGGRLGWIGRHGPMDEAFSRAAFALQKGQTSPPVRTPFGVALIRCDDVRPGSKSLAEARADVEEALAVELLRKLSATQRRRTTVKYTGAIRPSGPAREK
jgi:parvulin-like peptidyl-prolyl isomerase